MMHLICSATVCDSNHTTKVDGRSVKFYPYPNDEKLKHQWQKMCKSTCTSSVTQDSFRLCELHFKDSSFTQDMKLKSDAVPTIFDFPTKRKRESLFPFSKTKVYPPAKRRKPENQDDKNDINKSLQPKNLYHPLSSDTKAYGEFLSSHRLSIQRDKICPEPEPTSEILHSSCLVDKCKNAQNIQENLNNTVKTFEENLNESIQESLRLSDQIKSTPNNLNTSDQSSLNNLSQNNLNNCQENLNESNQKSSDECSLRSEKSMMFETISSSSELLNLCKNGCKLRNVIFSDSPAFMCEICGNIYIPRPMDITNISQYKPLQSQVKKNLTCDICYCKFKIQLEYENHMRLHTCMNPETPFLCYICNIAFETKPIIRNHILYVHVIGIQRENQTNFKQTVNLQCKICNLTFKNEETLRNHISSHKENNNSALPLKQFKSVKFACTVCSMEFTTSAEIDAHMKKHRETSVEDLTCNICHQILQNDQILRKHLRDHIARAPRCHLCSKAFVNESTLKRHLESHV